jgi:hypothetical protein
MLLVCGDPGVKTVNGSLLEVPPPQLTVELGVHSLNGNAGVDTVTWSVPTVVRSLAGITAAIPVVPMKMLTGSGLPFHSTAEHDEKPFPLAVSATGGPVNASSAAWDGLIELIVGRGSGALAGNCVSENRTRLEFVPGPLPDTVIATAAAPVARYAVSAADMAAVS